MLLLNTRFELWQAIFSRTDYFYLVFEHLTLAQFTLVIRDLKERVGLLRLTVRAKGVELFGRFVNDHLAGADLIQEFAPTLHLRRVQCEILSLADAFALTRLVAREELSAHEV